MATVANQPNGIDNKSLEEKYEYRNTDFGGRWHGADGGFLSKLESNPLFEKAKDSVQAEIDKLKGGASKPTTDSKPTANTPAPKGETTILGMHPMTLVLGTAGVLILATVGIIVVKMVNKK